MGIPVSRVADRRPQLPVRERQPGIRTVISKGITIYYFAYAGNLSKKQMRERCPDSQPKFKATLPNFKLVFTGWSRELRGGKATVKSFRGEKVRGAIYEVTDTCLRKLDRFEAGYSRYNITVFDEDNEPHEAVTYIKSGQLEESAPSQEYGAIIRQGYKDWGLI